MFTMCATFIVFPYLGDLHSKVSTMVLRFLLPALFTFLALLLNAQSHFLPPDDLSRTVLERREVSSGLEAPWAGALNAIESHQAVAYLLATDSLLNLSSSVARHRRRYFLASWNDALPDSLLTFPLTKRPLWGNFYRTPAFFFETDGEDFSVRLNPLLLLQLGRDATEGSLVFLNQRGLQVRGQIDNRVWFFTEVTETQARFPAYVNRRIQRDLAVPGNGFYKNFRSKLLGLNDAFDFLNARGYVGFHLTPHIGLRLGTGRHFIGNGMRSLLLSDFSNNTPYLELNTRIGRVHYQNLWAELTAASNTSLPGDIALPRKYLAAHSLGIRINPQLEITLFEAVVFSRNNRFDLSYLNPVIFYRAVEQAAGSPDNVLLGLNVRADAFRQLRFYGQLALDEFKLDELIIDNRGWWANKFGWQAGIKYFSAFGREDLRLQVEYNTVRPYTYSHRDSSARYTHYRQPLAHPIGANFRELLTSAHWQPLPRLQVELCGALIKVGEDEPAANWGNNPLLSSNTRVQDYGNTIAQGAESHTIMVSCLLSAELFHNAFVDLQWLYRKQNSALNQRDLHSSTLIAGIRLNVTRRQLTPIF